MSYEVIAYNHDRTTFRSITCRNRADVESAIKSRDMPGKAIRVFYNSDTLVADRACGIGALTMWRRGYTTAAGREVLRKSQTVEYLNMQFHALFPSSAPPVSKMPICNCSTYPPPPNSPSHAKTCPWYAPADGPIRIVVTVEGGCISGVYGPRGVEVAVVDFDNQKGPDGPEAEAVSLWEAEPLDLHGDSDAAKAIRAEAPSFLEGIQ